MTADRVDMGRKQIDWIIYGVVFGALLVATLYARHRASIKATTDESIEAYIAHADTYYWFAMAGRGSMAALGGGLKQLAKAEEKLKEATDLDEETRATLAAKIHGTRQDLEYQQVLHHDTFHGIFPWGHFMAKPTMFRNPRATGSFELIDQPEAVACRNAVNDMIDQVIVNQSVIAQYDVVFVSDPINQQLENEALYLFNLNPRFFVHNFLEVNGTLTPTEQDQLRNLELTEEMLEKLRESWGHNDILVVRLVKMDEVNHHHFYSAQGRLFAGTDPNPAVVLNNYGLCRDRRHMLIPVIVFNALMLSVAIVGFRILTTLTAIDKTPPDWLTTLALGGLGFVWGRCSCWGLAEIVEELVPEDETLAILTFWWPVVTGVVMLLGPALIIRFAENRFGWFGEKFGLFNRYGALFAAVTMGSCTYAGQAAIYLRMWGGWLMLPPFFLAGVYAAYVIGRALDQSDPLKKNVGICVFIVFLFLGPAFCNPKPSNLWFVAIPMTVVCTLGVRQSGLLTAEKEEDDEVEAGAVDSVPALMKRIQDPPFQTTESYRQAQDMLTNWKSGHTVRMQLVGAAGIGKTALIRAMTRHAKSDVRISVMEGVCPEPQDGAATESYRPFAGAIADHFQVNLLAPSQGQLSEIDKAVDGIFEEVVPFSEILFPPSEGEEGSAGSKREMFHGIAAMLRRLGQKQPILLIIDDAHWIDEGSQELLEFLLEEFPAGAPLSLALLIASRDPVDGFEESDTLTLKQLSEEEIRTLLTSGLGFSQNAATELAEAVGEQEGNMHWLFQMISYMANKDVLEWRNGFCWSSDTKLSDHLPDDLRNSIEAVVNSDPEFRTVLECAACIGPEFTVDVLSTAVGKSRLETIQILDRIEADTGIVRDQLHDDMFAFRSSFMLEVLRKILDVNAHGPIKPSPQRIREYHSQLAGAWHGTLETSTAGVFKLATHRYASGRRHADKALDEVLVAARAASAQFQHAQARRYVEMARECATAAGCADESLEEELLLIECHEAHVEGTHRVAVAEKALGWLGAHPDSDVNVYSTVALACYDAGVDTRDQTHFANAVAVAEQIIERFEEPVDQADGYHFKGIALPVAERDERRSHMEKAMALVEEAGGQIDALRLKAKIANSLGEQLSYGSDEDRVTAKEMFELSIELKSRPMIRDVEGLAFAHGGLGRLYYFAPEPDYDKSREHFAEDLRYSEKIGSRTGQSKMHSLLGGCDVHQNEDYAAAQDHYQQAYDLAEERIDQLFSLAGLIECSGKRGNKDESHQFGRTIQEIIRQSVAALPDDVRSENPVFAVPRMCQGPILTALEAAEATKDEAWHKWVHTLVADNKLL